MGDWNRGVVDEFRANEGRVGGMHEGRPVLLLHHRGARTGTERVSPLLYYKLENGYAVFASAGGSDKNPDWFYNIMANPEAKVEVENRICRYQGPAGRRRGTRTDLERMDTALPVLRRLSPQDRKASDPRHDSHAG